ncbi:MAG TPA: ABC transporter ATP-binding protein, partial [Stellaceae bacterium]|nr:ABC transporter ATP-binding protein [Stellaceae bacterium]
MSAVGPGLRRDSEFATEAAVAEPILHTEGLTVRFGGLTALANVDFAVARGELRAIIGPNGAG